MITDSSFGAAIARARTTRLTALCFAAFTFCWFAVLAARPLYEPDEGRYAEIPREMLGGDWIIPHLSGLAYLEKPPLQYWITAVVYRLTGENEFSARFWTGLCGYLSILIVFALARRLWGVRAAWFAAGSMCGSALFSLLSHQLTLDSALSFWLLAALACFIEAQLRRAKLRANRRWMLGCWAAMAGAVLTKGLIGALIPAASLILYAILQRDYLVFDRLNIRRGLPLFGLLVAPWFVLAARANSEFLNFFFIREHFERFLTPIEHRMQPWWFFLPVLALGVLPWLPQALKAIANDWRKRLPHGQFDPVRLLWIWSVFVVCFFSLSDSKLIPYILPALPALALLCSRNGAAGNRRAIAWGTGLSLAAAAGFGVFAAVLGGHAISNPFAVAFRVPLIIVALAIGVTSLVCAQLLREHRDSRAFGVLCAGWFVACMVLTCGGSPGDRLFSSRDLARLLVQTRVKEDPIFSIGTYEQTLPFYAGQTVTLVHYRGELDFGLRQAPGLGINTLEEFGRRWRALPQGYAVVDADKVVDLVATGIPFHEMGRTPNLVLVSRR